MRVPAILYLVVITCVGLSRCQDQQERIVRTSQGPVKGYKDSKYDIFEFFGIPYATSPTGKHRFKAPLPAPKWMSTFEAINRNVSCPQFNLPMLIGDTPLIQENCLIANVFVPDTTETNLPVAVYVHGGGFQIGNGIFFKAKKMLNKKQFLMVTFNYRLGPHGFLCLGTKDIPGNAGMKDQVALLRWVQENIASFGGNPNDVTIWGSSAGSASVDLLMLSPATKGLIHKVIPESGANLAAFTVQTDPIANAKEFAQMLNFTEYEDLAALEEFYKTISFESLYGQAFFFEKKDSTFGFSPCVETKTEEEAFLEESPISILKKGNYEKVPILYGFAEKEGFIRTGKFDSWKVNMNEKFSDFLPADLRFNNDNEKQEVAKEIKEFYFGDKTITESDILAYIDYFSDVIFNYPTLRAVQLHIKAGHDKIYLYEYSYVNEVDTLNSPVIPYTNNVRGANHCSQSAAVFDDAGMTPIREDDLPIEYLNVKALVRELWMNFIITGSPVPEGSSLPKWPPVHENTSPHMSIGRELELRGALLEKRVHFWDSIYERYYQEPQQPLFTSFRHTEL